MHAHVHTHNVSTRDEIAGLIHYHNIPLYLFFCLVSAATFIRSCESHIFFLHFILLYKPTHLPSLFVLPPVILLPTQKVTAQINRTYFGHQKPIHAHWGGGRWVGLYRSIKWRKKIRHLQGLIKVATKTRQKKRQKEIL